MRWLAVALALLLVACVERLQSLPPQGLYIALGDSLTAGVGASDRLSYNFPLLVAQALGLSHMNLGHPGDTSADLLGHGHLDLAVAEAVARGADADPSNDVVLITLTVGGNDMLSFYHRYFLTGECPDAATALSRPQCLQALQEAVVALRQSLETVLARLRQGAPAADIVVFTLYSPFAGQDSPLARMGDLVLEGGEGAPLAQGVNDVIREVAVAYRAKVAEAFAVLSGRPELMAEDGIHPNDEGYRLMAQLVLAALQAPVRDEEGHEEVRGGGPGGGPGGIQRGPTALPRGGARPPAGATPSAPR